MTEFLEDAAKVHKAAVSTGIPPERLLPAMILSVVTLAQEADVDIIADLRDAGGLMEQWQRGGKARNARENTMKLPSALELMVAEQATKDVVAAVGEYHPYYAVTALSLVLATKVAALPDNERGMAIAIINEHLGSTVKNLAE